MVSLRQLVVAAVLLCGCSRDDAPVDTTAVGAPAPAPAPRVREIPAWPADTPGFAIDRPYGITPAQRSAVPRCSSETPVVATDGIGPIYPGQPLASLLDRCPDVYLAWHWDDGRYGPAVAVQLGGALVVADVSGTGADAMVTRVAAFDRARTAEGIGPGSPLADVERAYGAPSWRRQQCAVDALFASTPGLVVRTAVPEDGSDAWSCDAIRRLGTGDDFSRFPKGSRVSWIAVELGGPR